MTDLTIKWEKKIETHCIGIDRTLFMNLWIHGTNVVLEKKRNDWSINFTCDKYGLHELAIVVIMLAPGRDPQENQINVDVWAPLTESCHKMGAVWPIGRQWWESHCSGLDKLQWCLVLEHSQYVALLKENRKRIRAHMCAKAWELLDVQSLGVKHYISLDVIFGIYQYKGPESKLSKVFPILFSALLQVTPTKLQVQTWAGTCDSRNSHETEWVSSPGVCSQLGNTSGALPRVTWNHSMRPVFLKAMKW